jgi:hypothetical protein
VEQTPSFYKGQLGDSYIPLFKQYFLESKKSKRMSAGMDVKDIAKKDKVPVSTIKKQIKMGQTVERTRSKHKKSKKNCNGSSCRKS